MGLFGRRREPLHERLLREGDFAPASVGPPGGAPPPQPPVALRPLDPLHGARPREWDAVVTVTAPGVNADGIEFVVLDDGTAVAEEEVPEGSLEAFRQAVDGKVRRPYRATAVRHEGGVWAVSAKAIRVVQLRVGGEELDFTVTREGRILVVDGETMLRGLPELEHDLSLPREFHARASRLTGDRWELDVVAL